MSGLGKKVLVVMTLSLFTKNKKDPFILPDFSQALTKLFNWHSEDHRQLYFIKAA